MGLMPFSNFRATRNKPMKIKRVQIQNVGMLADVSFLGEKPTAIPDEIGVFVVENGQIKT